MKVRAKKSFVARDKKTGRTTHVSAGDILDLSMLPRSTNWMKIGYVAPVRSGRERAVQDPGEKTVQDER
jgi:hypothetical protein